MGQFERKVAVYASVGYSGFSQNKKSTNDAQNALSDYKSGQTLAVSAFYALDGHLSIGGSLRFLLAEKSYYTIFSNTLGASVKYNIIPSDKRVSPYVFFEGNLGYNSLKQNSHSSTVTVAVPGADPGSIKYIQTTTNYQSVSSKFVPSFGIFFGGGADIKVHETLHFFVQAGYNTTYLKNNSTINSHFNNPNSNLSYLNISVGVRLNLFQKKTFY